MASVLNAPQVRNHVPQLGRQTGVELALLPKGQRPRPVDQILYVGGFLGTYTVSAVTATSSYIAVVGGQVYTVLATATDSQKSVVFKLINLINLGTAIHGAIAQAPRNVSGAIWAFDVYRPDVTFTLAATGTTTPADVTVGAVAGNTTAITKGATSIVLLAPLRGDIQKDQFLQAVDAIGTEYLVRLAATAIAGSSTLSVVAIDEAIAVGSQIGFLVEFFDRTSADSNRKIDKADFSTFNTFGAVDAVATKITSEGKLAGNFYERCPGYNTADFAASNGREVWLRITDPDFRDGWSRRSIEGAALILSQDKPRKVDGFISNDLSYQFLGKPIETAAAPLY